LTAERTLVWVEMVVADGKIDERASFLTSPFFAGKNGEVRDRVKPQFPLPLALA
jgi:hypothetical protein